MIETERLHAMIFTGAGTGLERRELVEVLIDHDWLCAFLDGGRCGCSPEYTLCRSSGPVVVSRSGIGRPTVH